VIAPHESPWTVVVVDDLPDLASRRPPCLLGYVYAADHGFDLSLFVAGERVARLSAASDVGHRYALHGGAAFVEHRVWSRDEQAAIERLLASRDWCHDDVRDKVAKAAGFKVEAWLAWRFLEHDGWDLLEQRFPDGVLLEGGVRHVRDDEAELDELLHAEDAARAAKAAAAGKSAGNRRGKAPARRGGAKANAGPRASFTAAEGRALSEAFRDAAPLVAEHVEKVGDVDLAACATPRAWLDTKKRIDPNAATDAVVAELERTVREGRFHEDADRATVVREAAAMVLGRCIAKRAVHPAAWLEARRAAAASDAERAAWDIVATTAGIKPAQ
jgi:hypothetical protein